MRRLPVLTALVACGALLAPVGLAEAAKKSTKPVVKRVTPMRVTVGKTLTIRGTNFSTSRKRNTVLFSAGKRQAFAKPSRASSKKLVLKIPSSVENLLGKVSSGKRKPTRLKLRVVTKRYGKLTTLRLSPIVLSAVRQGSTPGCNSSGDQDKDLLAGSVELKYALNPCKADTDNDGLTDGWEYWAAKDLNIKAYPYPGKKPYPNPLRPGDQNTDFDGDHLTAAVEFKLWKLTGSSFAPELSDNGLRDSPLGYSDGTQTSRPGETPSVPAFKVFGGLAASYPSRLDRRPDGQWSDDERDADTDGLNNLIETVASGKAEWWTAFYSTVPPWPETYYGAFTRRPFADVEPDDPDADGDSLLDAEDDQDNDDVLNFDEMYDVAAAYANGRRKNAFNPCAPDGASRTCPQDPIP